MHPRRFIQLRRFPVIAALALGAALLLPLQGAVAATTYEAENATIYRGTVDSNHAGFTGTGFVNYENVAGSYVEWTVNVASAGSATLTFRYANGSSANRPMDITVNSSLAANDLAFNVTGAWSTWRTVTTTVNLGAGSNKIRATAVGSAGGPNVDNLVLGVSNSESLLSKNQPATSSSNETSTLTPDKAVDGNTGTRWASAEGSDPQWIRIDLGATATISRVTLNWEAAYAKAYTIQVSDTGTTWSTVKSVTAGDGGIDDHTGLTAQGRYVRMHGTQRGTQWGYSLWEFEVFGTRGGVDPSPSPSPTPPPTGSTPAQINGQLKVCGVKLCNKYGNPIQLRGMSSHGLQWYHQCLPDAALDALAKDWNADVMRISMYIQEGGYETDPRGFTDKVHALIEKATARGMYAIVDWHMLSPGDPHYNLSRAKTFFTEIAQRHNNKTNLLYEIANEPSGVSWSRIKSYADELIPVIRQQDPETPVIVGTRGWSSLGVSESSDETEIVNNPVSASNILYTFHFYAASHRDEYLSTLSRAADKLPIFVTEFGTQDYTGDGGNDFTMSQRYLDLMASKKISWVNWNYSDDHRSGAVFKTGTCPAGPYAGTTSLKPAGTWIRDRIRTPDNFPTT